jgi:transposase
MKILKQVLGIDVAQKELVVSLGRMYEDLTIDIYANKVFANRNKGFDALIVWTKKLTDSTISTRFVMEATGVYHESLAYFLVGHAEEVSIVLPNKISNYFRTLEVKTITDNTSCEAITRFGLERKLELWQRPKPIFKKLKQLCRERDQVVDERTMVKNQFHAEQAEAEPNGSSIVRIKKRIQLLDRQEKEIKKEIAELVKKDAHASQATFVITSIPGVGLLTAATVLAETNGFELIRNKRQLSSYAGLDVKEKQSGTSIKGKSKISKRGNRYLRKSMHLPALAAIRSNDQFKQIFIRIVSKHSIKMKAVVAVQRKLLELIYILYKTNTPYNKDHFKNHIQLEKEKQSL